MPVTTPPTITALPTPPDPNDRSTFNSRAYPWSVAQQTLATEVGAVAANVYGNATDAAASATAADLSKTAAASSEDTATAAAANLATLDALWLGAATADPSTGKAGAPLVAGNAYVNSVTGYLRAYDGSGWVQGISAVAGVASVNGLTGAVTITIPTPLPPFESGVI